MAPSISFWCSRSTPEAPIPSAPCASRYRAANAVRFFKDHDEFYWNVTGNDWKVPIESASAFVALPSAAAGQVKAQAFTGAFGSREQEAVTSIDGSNISFDISQPLPPRSGLTIDVYIPKGILKEPSWFTRYVVWFVGGNPGALLPVWAFAVMFGLWLWKGRDPDPGISVAPMYEPPKGLTPAEAGTLLADDIEARDITSTLIDLAVKGYLKIIETEDKVLFIKHKDYTLRLMKPRSEWQNLAAHELEVLNNIFPEVTAEETTLSSLKNRFYVALPSIRQEIMASLKGKDLYSTDPESAKGLGDGRSAGHRAAVSVAAIDRGDPAWQLHDGTRGQRAAHRSHRLPLRPPTQRQDRTRRTYPG